MLKRFFGSQTVAPQKRQRALAVIDTAHVETIKREPYRWLSDSYRKQATARLQEMNSAISLGLMNQATLSAKKIMTLSFLDFTEGNGLDVHEFQLVPLSENYDTGLHRIEGKLDLWMMFKPDNKVVHLPQGALNALETLLQFPQPFIQEAKILQQVNQTTPQRDFRFTEEKGFFPLTIPAPDPLLVIKVGDSWFSVFQWE